MIFEVFALIVSVGGTKISKERKNSTIYCTLQKKSHSISYFTLIYQLAAHARVKVAVRFYAWTVCVQK